MQSFCLTICRMTMAGWVGAAVLFVVTSVVEQSGPNFDNVIRDHLAVMRFPYYYGFGFALVGVSLAAGFACRRHSAVGPKLAATFLICTTLALVMMVADYIWIYQPLAQLITPPGSVRTSDFTTYHNASKYVNMADLLLCLIAAIAICWPARRSPAATQ